MRQFLERHRTASRIIAVGLVGSAGALAILRPWEESREQPTAPGAATSWGAGAEAGVGSAPGTETPSSSSARPSTSASAAKPSTPSNARSSKTPGRTATSPAAAATIPEAVRPEADTFLDSISSLPVERQMGLIMLQDCDWRREDLQLWSRYGHTRHGVAISDIESRYSELYLEANDVPLENVLNDGGMVPNYARTQLSVACPDVVTRPAG